MQKKIVIKENLNKDIKENGIKGIRYIKYY